MEQTDPEQYETYSSQEPQEENYWPSVLLVGGIFSLIGFVTGLLLGYMEIGSEPDGSLFSPMMISGVVICLATCVGGLFAVWHYSRQGNPRIQLGRGALIGFMTGAAIVVFSALLEQFWSVVDPTYSERLLESIIDNVEAMNVPSETRDQMIDQMAAGARETSFFEQVFYGIPITGILNLLTGMLGVRMFAQRDQTALSSEE